MSIESDETTPLTFADTSHGNAYGYTADPVAGTATITAGAGAGEYDLAIDAIGGVFQISIVLDGTTYTTSAIAHDASGDVILEAIEALGQDTVGTTTTQGPFHGHISVEAGSGHGNWTLTLTEVAPSSVTAIDTLIVLQDGDQEVVEASTLTLFNRPVFDATNADELSDIENISGSGGDDLLIGNADANVFYFGNDWGHDIVIGKGGDDSLNFDELSPRQQDQLNAAALGNGVGLVYTLQEGSITNSVIVVGSFENLLEADEESDFFETFDFGDQVTGFLEGKLALPQISATSGGTGAVSYTHLTLPTKRIV